MVTLLHLSNKMYIGQGIVQSLFVKFMGAMLPTLPSTTWYGICEEDTIWLWSHASLDARLLRKRAQNIKIMDSNPLDQFHHNEKKVIVKAKKHTNLEWNRLQVTLQDT